MPPTLDPCYVSLAARCRAIRVDVDRLDDAVELLDPGANRSWLATAAATMRELVDDLELRVEQMAAGL